MRERTIELILEFNEIGRRRIARSLESVEGELQRRRLGLGEVDARLRIVGSQQSEKSNSGNELTKEIPPDLGSGIPRLAMVYV